MTRVESRAKTQGPKALSALAAGTAGPGEAGVLELERFLPYRLSVAANRVSRAIANLYEREFELTIPEWRVIAVLANRPLVSATMLCSATAMDKVAISRAVKRLILMDRVRASVDADDGRRQRLKLTTKGAALYRRIAPQARRYERALLDILGEHHALGLDQALDRLLEALPER